MTKTIERTEHFIGVDLGQKNDFTALAVVEAVRTLPVVQYEHVGSCMPRPPEPRVPATYNVRHLERRPLGENYAAVSDHAVKLHRQVTEHGGRCDMVVDGTGVGRGIVDILRDRGLQFTPISITAGRKAHFDDGYWLVPKLELVAVMQRLLQERRLRIAAGLVFAPVLKQELANFSVKINTATGNDSYGAWRESVHDDLVLALASALWLAEQPRRQRQRINGAQTGSWSHGLIERLPPRDPRI